MQRSVAFGHHRPCVGVAATSRRKSPNHRHEVQWRGLKLSIRPCAGGSKTDQLRPQAAAPTAPPPFLLAKGGQKRGRGDDLAKRSGSSSQPVLLPPTRGRMESGSQWRTSVAGEARAKFELAVQNKAATSLLHVVQAIDSGSDSPDEDTTEFYDMPDSVGEVTQQETADATACQITHRPLFLPPMIVPLRGFQPPYCFLLFPTLTSNRPRNRP